MAHPTSYTSFIAALYGLTVTGVTRKFSEPPQQVNTADLPIMFTRLPSGTEAPITGQSNGGWPTLRADLVILVEPYHQNRTSVNYALALTLMDNLSAALRASDLAEGPTRWTIETRLDILNDTPYWIIIASVETTG